MMTKKRKTKNTYKVEIYFVGEKRTYVRATNERSAMAIARRRIAKTSIGFKNIRTDMSEIDEVFTSEY